MSSRKECVKDLARILPELNLEFISSVIDESSDNGFYSEEPNITYPRSKKDGKHEPYFIAEIGTVDGDKHKMFVAKFYVWGSVSFISGYDSKISKEVSKQYFEAIEKSKKEVQRKRKFELVYE